MDIWPWLHDIDLDETFHIKHNFNKKHVGPLESTSSWIAFSKKLVQGSGQFFFLAGYRAVLSNQLIDGAKKHLKFTSDIIILIFLLC